MPMNCVRCRVRGNWVMSRKWNELQAAVYKTLFESELLSVLVQVHETTCYPRLYNFVSLLMTKTAQRDAAELQGGNRYKKKRAMTRVEGGDICGKARKRKLRWSSCSFSGKGITRGRRKSWGPGFAPRSFPLHYCNTTRTTRYSLFLSSEHLLCRNLPAKSNSITTTTTALPRVFDWLIKFI